LDTDWTQNPPVSANFQFTTVKIDASLTIPSGLTIRSLGDFYVAPNASITVAQSPNTNQAYGYNSNPGLALRIADGALGGAVGVGSLQASQFLHPGIFGGSPGYAGYDVRFCMPSGEGGGTLVLRVGGTLTVNGTITAKGADGASCATDGPYYPGTRNGLGGGGGGFILAGVQGTVNIPGTVDVSGGNGGNGADDLTYDPMNPAYGGNGSGGGGGILHIISPFTPAVGRFQRSGGTAGSGSTPGKANSYPGGACGGSGGGVIVPNQFVAFQPYIAATDGSPGYMIFTQAPSPSTLFQ
jgi:hypothetical protein